MDLNKGYFLLFRKTLTVSIIWPIMLLCYLYFCVLYNDKIIESFDRYSRGPALKCYFRLEFLQNEAAL